MRRLVGALLSLWIGALALADTRAPTSTAATESESITGTLRQLELDWADAEKAPDSDKLGRIVADDWTGVNNDGRKLTKEQLIERMKSGKAKAESVEFGPMDVKVLGDVAVVQGTDVEIGMTNGAHANGQMVWMDVFAKRDGKWVAVRSQSARAGTASRPRWPI